MVRSQDRPSKPLVDCFYAHETQVEPRIRTDNQITTRQNHRPEIRKNIKIATLNVSTMRDKEEEIVHMMKERNLDILRVCETRTKNEGQKTIHEDYKYIYKGNQEGRHGVGFVLNSSVAERVKEITYKTERILSISMELNNTGISLIMVYAPQQGRNTEEKEEFHETLQETYDSVKYRNNVIMMGDWNGHVGMDREGIEGVLGAFSVGNRNAEGKRIIDFCATTTILTIMNTFYLHRLSHKWTWYKWNENQQQYTDKSMIDLMVTNNKNLFKDVKAIHTINLTRL